jgi:CheY-like chemotaxis protein
MLGYQRWGCRPPLDSPVRSGNRAPYRRGMSCLLISRLRERRRCLRMKTRRSAAARLLVVEPDAAVRELLCAALSEEGYVTCGAATVEEALALVDHRAFDCILTDDTRVGTAQDPLCVARALRQRAQPTPVGVLTAWPLTPEAGDCRDLAFVLPKPCDLDHLYKQVAAALGATAAGAPRRTRALEPAARRERGRAPAASPSV